MTKWKEWPKWNDDESSFRTPRFEFSCSTKDYSGKTSVDQVALLKDRKFIEAYRDLTSDAPMQSIFEIGFFQGGMPLFLADMIVPEKIVAIDWHPPTEELLNLIERSKLSTSLELIGDVDQGDAQRIRSILDEKFGSKALDLIIDDCSHYYPQTKGCFEALFGYLRPGGKYIIEDWGWTHWPDAPWQTDESPFRGMESMTNLIFELVMAMASDQTKISGINILSPACVVVTRGEALGYKEPVDLRTMTNLAGGRRAELIVFADSVPVIARAFDFALDHSAQSQNTIIGDAPADGLSNPTAFRPKKNYSRIGLFLRKKVRNPVRAALRRAAGRPPRHDGP
jgi:SAM-dependent methyltransferase